MTTFEIKVEILANIRGLMSASASNRILRFRQSLRHLVLLRDVDANVQPRLELPELGIHDADPLQSTGQKDPPQQGIA